MTRLTPELLLNAYASGLFPMAVGEQRELCWFSPDPRALIPLDERFHISHGLKKVLRRNRFEITCDRSFAEVITACSVVHGETWISKEILNSYLELHRLGFAHSVETRLEGELVGGLYGVHLRGAFFGESMFHRATDASKVALVALVEKLRRAGFVLLDTQWTTPHLMQFGTYEVPRDEYLALLEEALLVNCPFELD